MDRLEQHLEELSTDDRSIVTTRVLNAPRSLVFQAWADPRHLANWWGPKGFRNTFNTFQFYPQGIWEFTMHGPNGVDYPNKSFFVEIVEPERIVFDHVSSHPFRLIASFEELGEKTKLVFRMVHPTVEESEKAKHYIVQANEENMDRLESELEKIKAERQR
jgi:uncharacterized protein YndB with AHSA1/START domain